MPSPAPSNSSSSKALRRFRRNRRGSAAVEFALVAPMFFALLFAIIETAIVFFAGQVLETVTQNSARMIMTGQAQSGRAHGQSRAGVSTPCSKTSSRHTSAARSRRLFDCGKLYVDVGATHRSER